jgi:hypothetical protein
VFAFTKFDDDDLNIYVTRSFSLFASNVSDIHHVDFANHPAVFLKSPTNNGERQVLKQGRGKSTYVLGRSLEGTAWGTSEVRLKWQRALDPDHWIVGYHWYWTAASSSQSEILQVFELRDGKVFITQQIEADLHGGRSIGAMLNPRSRRLTVKSVELNSPNGRCCPTYINTVVFDWTGERFRRISAHRAPVPNYKR